MWRMMHAHELNVEEVSVGGTGDSAVQHADMSVQTVDRALEEVRPYLMADGGNVTVVDVRQGMVFLRLEACQHLFRLCFQLPDHKAAGVAD